MTTSCGEVAPPWSRRCLAEYSSQRTRKLMFGTRVLDWSGFRVTGETAAFSLVQYASIAFRS